MARLTEEQRDELFVLTKTKEYINDLIDSLNAEDAKFHAPFIEILNSLKIKQMAKIRKLTIKKFY